jgi:GNAT superfamily N-acetyltransferase
LYNGKHIYIDDLSTLPEYRGKGYAGLLLDYVESEAIVKGYQAVTLDSGHHRAAAHRLYMNKGFTIVAHHFSKTLK